MSRISLGSGVPTWNGVPMIGGLPMIRGQYYFVDPYQGSDGNRGKSSDKAFASFAAAYAACTDGVGDGIAVLSGGTTTANTTSYLTSAITWSKSGITAVGVSAPTYMYGRARVANASTATSLATLITMSGSNNAFYNIHLSNGGSNAAALGCLTISGDRNYFENCHVMGAAHATPAVLTGSHSLSLSGCEDSTFVNCTFGTDTVDQDGSQAVTGVVKFASLCGRILFKGCKFLSYYSYANGTCGLVHMVASDCIMRHVVFDDCIFMNYKEGLLATNDPQSVFVGTAPDNGAFLLHKCAVLGFGAIDATAGNDRVYNASPAANLVGGVGVVTS